MTRARPRLLLHIGTHKTGTSALQASLQAGRDHLLTAGVCYPDTSRPPWPELPKHCSVFHAAVSDDPALREAERAWLLAQARQPGVHTLVISEEGLSEPQAQLPAFFAPLAESLDIEVLCCLRRQDLFVESLFNQFVREQARHESRPPLLFARAPSMRARLDHHALLSRWVPVARRMHVADFDALRSGEGLLAWFARVGQLSLDDLPEQRANASPDMRLALLLNRLNRQRTPYRLGPLLAASRQLASRQPGARQTTVLGQDERRRLLAEHTESNARLAADFGVRFDDSLPADEGAMATEEPGAPYLEALLAELSQSGG